jgi:acyl-CoA thioester hydrolase
MNEFQIPVQVRWADLDPNFHLRHSIYYDWGAMCRLSFLYKVGITMEVMHRLHVGPILFREEAIFKKEVRLGDEITIDLKAIKAKKDFSRWTAQHHIIKNTDTLAAIVTVDIAWIDTQLRKLAKLPAEMLEMGKQIPMDENFQWID